MSALIILWSQVQALAGSREMKGTYQFDLVGRVSFELATNLQALGLGLIFSYMTPTQPQKSKKAFKSINLKAL